MILAQERDLGGVDPNVVEMDHHKQRQLKTVHLAEGELLDMSPQTKMDFCDTSAWLEHITHSLWMSSMASLPKYVAMDALTAMIWSQCEHMHVAILVPDAERGWTNPSNEHCQIVVPCRPGL